MIHFKPQEAGQASPGSFRQDSLRRWLPVAHKDARPDGVLLDPPVLDDHPGLMEAVEDLAV